MFYELDHEENYLGADWADGMDLEQIICPKEKSHMRGGKRIGDLMIELPSPNIKDFVWIVFGGECLITDKVAGLFKEAGFTGYELKPVTVKKVKRMGKEPKPIPQLWEMVITGW
ncbi:MAG: hypothetical protein AB1414_20855, partial [bacterium]